MDAKKKFLPRCSPLRQYAMRRRSAACRSGRYIDALPTRTSARNTSSGALNLSAVAWDGLRGSLEDATAVVRELMADPLAPPQTRLNAARTVLEFALKATEQLDILTRLEALEAAHNGP